MKGKEATQRDLEFFAQLLFDKELQKEFFKGCEELGLIDSDEFETLKEEDNE